MPRVRCQYTELSRSVRRIVLHVPSRLLKSGWNVVVKDSLSLSPLCLSLSLSTRSYRTTNIDRKRRERGGRYAYQCHIGGKRDRNSRHSRSQIQVGDLRKECGHQQATCRGKPAARPILVCRIAVWLLPQQTKSLKHLALWLGRISSTVHSQVYASSSIPAARRAASAKKDKQAQQRGKNGTAIGIRT